MSFNLKLLMSIRRIGIFPANSKDKGLDKEISKRYLPLLPGEGLFYESMNYEWSYESGQG